MLSRNLEKTLHRALDFANERRHEYATLEHLLLALTEDQDSLAVLKACGVDLDKLRADLVGITSIPTSPTSPPRARRMRSRPPVSSASSSAPSSMCSPPASDEVTGANVLVALFSERESHAVYFLQEQDMSRFDAVNYISHGIAKVPKPTEPRRMQGADGDRAAGREAGWHRQNETALEKGNEALDNTAST
jgi:ATP-dependent Clp protease ATP-binding subunit ClpA